MATYADGTIPELGDYVRNVNTGKCGIIFSVDLNPDDSPGQAKVSVKWNDGGGEIMARADDYALVARAPEVPL